MEENLIPIIRESIELELNVSNLYAIFYNHFAEDEDFWWELLLEERKHAALLRSAEEYYRSIDRLPRGLIHHRLRELKEANSRVLRLIDRYRDNPPGRAESFNIAHETENRAGEIHFQEFMEKGAESGIEEIFQRLNREDHHHSERIRAYMDENGIPFLPAEDINELFSE